MKKSCSGVRCAHPVAYTGGHCRVFRCANFAGHCPIDDHGMPLGGDD